MSAEHAMRCHEIRATTSMLWAQMQWRGGGRGEGPKGAACMKQAKRWKSNTVINRQTKGYAENEMPRSRGMRRMSLNSEVWKKAGG